MKWEGRKEDPTMAWYSPPIGIISARAGAPAVLAVRCIYSSMYVCWKGFGGWVGGCVLALLAIHPPTHPSIHITSCKYMEEHSNSSAFPTYEKPAGGGREEHKRVGE